MQIKHRFEIGDRPPGRQPFQRQQRGVNLKLVIGSKGEIYNPRWITRTYATNDKVIYTHTLSWIKVKVGVPAVIRQIEHILAGYEKQGEIENLNQLISEARQLWQFYRNYRRREYLENIDEVSNKLIDLAAGMGAVKNADKQKAKRQLLETGKKMGRDSLGRINPSALAAKLISAICALENRRYSAIGTITSEYAMRLVALKHIRRVQLWWIDRIKQKIQEALKDKAFSQKNPFGNIGEKEDWFSHLEGTIKNLMHTAAELEVQPYICLRAWIHNKLNQALAYRNAHLQLKIGKIFREILQVIAQPQTFPQQQRKLENIREMLETDKDKARGKIITLLASLSISFFEPYEGIRDDFGSALQKAAQALDENNKKEAKDQIDKAITRLHW